MAEETQTYQCPSCGAPLRFDSRLQKLKCDSCGNTYSIEEISQYLDEKEEPVSIEKGTDWSEEEQSHLKAYTCPGCGAQLISDDTTVATSCPYCGNNAIIPERAEGTYKPDYVIPFETTKEDAVKKLKSFYKGKPFLPKAFSQENHLEEIKGIYVPFWLYDGLAHTNLQYHGTRVSTFSQGEDVVTVTSHYAVGRQSETQYVRIPADASLTMPDALMDSIEPFQYKDLKPFDFSYLPGYLANRYDVDAVKDQPRADTRMKDTAASKTRRTIIGYSTLVPIHESVQLRNRRVQYAFLPVWLLSTKYKGKNYLFVMNGQTGKMAADPLPVSPFRFLMTFLLISAVGIVLLYFILF